MFEREQNCLKQAVNKYPQLFLVLVDFNTENWPIETPRSKCWNGQNGMERENKLCFRT